MEQNHIQIINELKRLISNAKSPKDGRPRLSQNEIARRIGVDNGQLSRMLSLKQGTSLKNACDILDVLGYRFEIVDKNTGSIAPEAEADESELRANLLDEIEKNKFLLSEIRWLHEKIDAEAAAINKVETTRQRKKG
jgi:transcriptional regulator with XRE-family HTH domain